MTILRIPVFAVTVAVRLLPLWLKIYKDKGKVGKDIEHYDKFLQLLKEADPGIPELIDAKER
ncbi:hypothetical protein CEE39_05925 [bacterium (candidate division B38) B3_B38]|nr:MAG: hypothetical protein CEE39_05925 [bacterium (candidate division B38) B3_B38]